MNRRDNFRDRDREVRVEWPSMVPFTPAHFVPHAAGPQPIPRRLQPLSDPMLRSCAGTREDRERRGEGGHSKGGLSGAT